MYAESITACYKQSINSFPASSILIYKCQYSIDTSSEEVEASANP